MKTWRVANAQVNLVSDTVRAVLPSAAKDFEAAMSLAPGFFGYFKHTKHQEVHKQMLVQDLSGICSACLRDVWLLARAPCSRSSTPAIDLRRYASSTARDSPNIKLRIWFSWELARSIRAWVCGIEADMPIRPLADKAPRECQQDDVA